MITFNIFFGGEIMRFIILNDSKGKEKGINAEVLTKLLRESKKLNPEPDFIVLGGDNIAGSIDKEAHIDQFRRLKALIRHYYADKMLIPIVGNHEVNNNPTDDSYEKIFEKVYSDSLPDTCLEGYNNTVYYADVKNTRLIILNSFHYGEINMIKERQLAWLKEIASEPIKNKLLFVHSPAFPTGAHYRTSLDLYPEYRDAFWKIVEQYGIDIVFSGHEHNYSRRKMGSKRPVYQIVSGGGGEKLRHKYKDSEGVIIDPIAKHHFVVVDVEKSGIKVCAISSEGKLLDEFNISKL
jgi:hypothetical protein